MAGARARKLREDVPRVVGSTNGRERWVYEGVLNLTTGPNGVATGTSLVFAAGVEYSKRMLESASL